MERKRSRKEKGKYMVNGWGGSKDREGLKRGTKRRDRKRRGQLEETTGDRETQQRKRAEERDKTDVSGPSRVSKEQKVGPWIKRPR
jgi:hypothetical protein